MVSPDPTIPFPSSGRGRRKRIVLVPVMMEVTIDADDDLESVVSAEEFIRKVPPFRDENGRAVIKGVLGTLDVTDRQDALKGGQDG